MRIAGRTANSGLSDVLTGPRGPTAVRGEALMSAPSLSAVRRETKTLNRVARARRVAREERQECVSHCVFQYRAIESANML
jgi:hypothetical protein